MPAMTRSRRKPTSKAAPKRKAKSQPKPKPEPKSKRAAAQKPAGKRTATANQKVRPIASTTRAAKATPKPKAPPHGATLGGRLWPIIERMNQLAHGDHAKSCEAFERALDALDDTALVAAVTEFDEAMRRAYDYNVWGAAYLIHGGCSDDAFWDFRAGLVAMGKAVYERALADPDSLANIEDVEDRTLFEGFQYIPTKLVERRGLARPPGGHMDGEPTGESWADDDELARRFPKIAARFD